jgi:hypothetical protein
MEDNGTMLVAAVLSAWPVEASRSDRLALVAGLTVAVAVVVVAVDASALLVAGPVLRAGT